MPDGVITHHADQDACRRSQQPYGVLLEEIGSHAQVSEGPNRAIGGVAAMSPDTRHCVVEFDVSRLDSSDRFDG